MPDAQTETRCCVSLDDLKRELDQREKNQKDLYERFSPYREKIDGATQIPHLLIEIRSLGTVEVCGKDGTCVAYTDFLSSYS